MSRPLTAAPAAANTPAEAALGWLQVLNPPIYLISILPAVGVLLTAGYSPSMLAILPPATLAVVLLQHGINLLNDVSDWRLGADVDKHESWVRFHAGGTRAASLHGRLSLLAGALLGLVLLVMVDRLWILGLAAPLVVLGYLYNAGERPLSYTRLGEWVTGICYGPGVFGCLWLLTGRPLDAAAFAGMLAFGALAMALLLSHQPPQIATDRAAGKSSFAVRFGAATTRSTARGLFALFVLSFALGLWSAAGSLLTVGAFVLAALWLAVGMSRPAPKIMLKSATLALIAAILAVLVSALL